MALCLESSKKYIISNIIIVIKPQVIIPLLYHPQIKCQYGRQKTKIKRTVDT